MDRGIGNKCIEGQEKKRNREKLIKDTHLGERWIEGKMEVKERDGSREVERERERERERGRKVER